MFNFLKLPAYLFWCFFSTFFLNLSHFECCWGQHFTIGKWSNFNKKSFHQISKWIKYFVDIEKLMHVRPIIEQNWVSFKKKYCLWSSTSDLSFFLSQAHILTLSVSLTHIYSRFLSYALFFYVHLSLSLSLLYTHIHTYFYTPSLSFIHLSTIHTHTLFHTYTDFLKNIFIYILSLSHRYTFSPIHTHTHIILYYYSLSRTHTFMPSLFSASMLASTYIHLHILELSLHHTYMWIYILTFTYIYFLFRTNFLFPHIYKVSITSKNPLSLYHTCIYTFISHSLTYIIVLSLCFTHIHTRLHT